MQELEKELAAEREKLKEVCERETLQAEQLRSLSHVMGGKYLVSFDM